MGEHRDPVVGLLDSNGPEDVKDEHANTLEGSKGETPETEEARRTVRSEGGTVKKGDRLARSGRPRQGINIQRRFISIRKEDQKVSGKMSGLCDAFIHHDPFLIRLSYNENM